MKKELRPRYSPDEVIIKLKKVIKLIEKMQDDMKDDGITHAQARVIFPIIRDERGFTIQELANIGGVTKGLVSRTISDLEKKGIVEREKKSADQDRNFKIVLAKKGLDFVESKKTQMQEVSSKWSGKITHEDLETFMRVLDAFTEM